jgi:hypothetical protein
MMQDWHPDQKRKLRGEILRMLAKSHAQQKARMDDVALCHMLRAIAWEIDLNDVVTILQEMEGRQWVTFRTLRNVYMRRVQLLQIEILPAGQDLVDQTTTNPAVEF